MAKKLELSEADSVYAKALNVMLNDGMLKLHNVDVEDLNHVGSTINWIRQLQVRIAKAPEELTAGEVASKAEKIEPDPKKKTNRRVGGK